MTPCCRSLPPARSPSSSRQPLGERLTSRGAGGRAGVDRVTHRRARNGDVLTCDVAGSRSGRGKSNGRASVIVDAACSACSARTPYAASIAASRYAVTDQPVIVSAVRTPTGKFLGALKSFTAPELGAIVVREAVRRAGDRSAHRSTSASWATSSAPASARTPARQAALNGGLSDHVAALTINKVCGSGLKAVMLAAQGDRDRRHRHRGRRRHGVDEQRAVSAAARARGAADGQRHDSSTR